MARILVLTPGFVTPANGAQVPAVVDLLGALGRRHQLSLHLISPEVQSRGQLSLAGLTFIPHGRSRAQRVASLSWALARDPRFDLIWTLWLRRSAPFALLAERLLRKPLIASVIGGEVSTVPAAGYGEGGSRLGRQWVGRLLDRARLITVGSPWLAQTLAAEHPRWASRVVETPFGVPELPVREEPPWDGRSPLRLVAVTRVEPVKDPDLLLEAIAVLLRQGVDVSLDIYGFTEAPDRSWLQARAEALGLGARVQHRGLVRPEVLRAAYPGYHALVHASRHESQGMALIEAAVIGLPVATTQVGVAAELQGLGAALALAASEPAGLAASIRQAAAEAGRGRAAVLERYGLEACAARFERCFERALA